jgi:hypothetical protein
MSRRTLKSFALLVVARLIEVAEASPCRALHLNHPDAPHVKAERAPQSSATPSHVARRARRRRPSYSARRHGNVHDKHAYYHTRSRGTS